MLKLIVRYGSKILADADYSEDDIAAGAAADALALLVAALPAGECLRVSIARVDAGDARALPAAIEQGARADMAEAGLVLLRPWTPAGAPPGLHLEGFKPHRREISVRAVMSAPRLGFNDMWACAAEVLPALGIPLTKVGGAFWDQSVTLGLTDALADGAADYILTLDYDSVFNRAHVARLLELALVHPAVDAIAPLQASRHNDKPLFGVRGDVGTETEVARETVEVDLYQVAQAHFGLTLLKASKLRALPKPWLVGTPDAGGEWGPGKVDADIHFWRQWEAAGNNLALAPRVVIGHLELMVRWPDQGLAPIWQSAQAWERTRRAPPGTWTGIAA
ncbi:MAG: hypothetical protein J0H82_25995 [Alphaproteobacteria bacterium]|nr:hypothetical protein [Alphaproteobacteria bacterium]